MIVTLGMILNVVNNYDVNFIMPISKIDQNMDKAHTRDGLLTQKFWFKSNILSREGSYKRNDLKSTNYVSSNSNLSTSSSETSETNDEELEQFYIYEILEGNETFKGLFPLI
jgi:glutamate--cysteine ligase catalytic subunit